MSELQWGVFLTEIGGGLALFLYGMRQMTESLKIVAGDGMKRLLARLTTNRFTAALAGGVVTAVIQSSSVTTVLVVGFISAGLLQFTQSVGVILGANVGTTVTAQIIAFQVYKYGLLLIAIGFFTEVFARRERVRQWGTAAMGLGLIFFGMELMSIATGPFREWPPFIDLMQNMSNPAITVAIGAVFTAIVQSSSATTGIVIVLASQGLISLETGIGIILGANIGTCVTAFASAFGRPREALQAAWAHLIFNVAGVLLWVFFIDAFADIVRTLSPVTPGLEGLELAAADTPRQIANAHTIFNFANLFLFIWFTGPLATLIQRIVPIPPAPAGVHPKYLDDYFLEQPSLALDLVRKELTHLGELTRSMIDRALDTTVHGSEQEAAALSKADDDVDTVYGDIIRYLGRLSQQDLIAPQPKQLQDYVGIANYLENVGDVIDKELLAVAAKRRRNSLVIGPKTQEKLRELAGEVQRVFGLALRAVESGDPEIALEVLESKSVVLALAEDASMHVAKRLVAEEPHRLETFQIETDIIELYRRLNTLSRRIARLSIDASIAGAHPEDTEGEL
ncbi:MAG: Na/Pi cotransporter family protein [Woeseiaceae bacterium]|nr:Na/Pi cotransporter family protein [Woeseiaceae bacterium]